MKPTSIRMEESLKERIKICAKQNDMTFSEYSVYAIKRTLGEESPNISEGVPADTPTDLKAKYGSIDRLVLKILAHNLLLTKHLAKQSSIPSEFKDFEEFSAFLNEIACESLQSFPLKNDDS